MRALGVAVLVGRRCCAAPSPASAQMELGVIKGRVVDEAGKPMQGVTIRLVNVDRGREVTITTDKDGRFYRRGLQVGGYELKVEHQGYQPVSNTIKIGGGTDSDFDFRLAKAAAGGSKEFQEGVAAFNAKDFAGAAAKFEAAIAQTPTVAPLHVNLALAYFQLKRPAEAVASLEKAGALAPNDAADPVPAGQRLRGHAGLRQGGGGAARRAWRSRRTWPRIRWPPKPPRRSARCTSRRARWPKPRRSSRRCSPPRPATPGPRSAWPRSISARATPPRRWSCSNRSSRPARERPRPRRPRPSSKSSRRAYRRTHRLA